MPNLILINSASNEPFVGLYLNGVLHVEKGTSDNLIACLDSLTKQFPDAVKTMDAISVVTGPGSFTGIRVGIAIAKGAALALQKKIIPITGFEIFYNRISNPDPSKEYCVLLPAKLPEYYYAIMKDGNELSRGYVQISEIDIILTPGMIVVGEPDRFGKSDEGSMLELSLKHFEQEKMFPPEQIEPVYIKEFVVH